MQLKDILQEIIEENLENESVYKKQVITEMTSKQTKEALQTLFPGTKVSNSLGVNASSYFGSVVFDAKSVISGLKQKANVTVVKHIQKDKLHLYSDLPTSLLRSRKSEIFLVKYKDSTGKVQQIYFKDSSGAGKQNVRNVPSVVAVKELTPDALGLSDKVHSRDDLLNFIKKHKFNPKIDPIIKMIGKAISKERSSSVDIDYEIKDLDQKMSEISDQDESHILKDFGEVFSAIVSSGPNDKIFFPKQSNFSLIDFIIERQDGKEKSYSAKFNKGARPSLTGVIQGIKQTIDNMNKNKKILKDDAEELEVYNVLQTIESNTSFVANEKLSKMFKLEKKVKAEVEAEAAARGIDLTNKRKSEIAYNYVRGKHIKAHLNTATTSSGKKFLDVFSSLMNASFNIDQVVIKERDGDKMSWKYFKFSEAKFKFEEKNAFEAYTGKLSFSVIQNKK